MGQNSTLGSEDELLAKASLLFDNKNFEEAKPLYSQLLSLYPKDPEYNYKYGTCLLLAGSDREQALEYIKYAISKGGVEDEVYFYLGQAYHKNYEFEKAIEAYMKYKERVPSSSEKEYGVDHHIQMCENGRKLLKKFNGLKVIQAQDMSLENFYRIYQLEGLKGQLLAKPEKFMSKYDQKVNDNSIMFFPENAKELYFTSYGDKGENGKDIYKVVLINKGKWSDPINLGPVINTPFDEDFVFVHPETNEIYFASTGHTSMGGYDLFKSTYDPEIAGWTEAENLDFPYSTVDNDYMYVSTPDNPIAFFASDRFKPLGKTSVYKVNTEEVEPDIAVIKGKLNVEGIPEIQNATITVKDEKGNLISKVETKRNSTYELAFGKNGGNYVFNIETTEDSPIHSGKISLPENKGLNVYSQELVLGGSLENQSLLIKNDFENTTATTVEELNLPAELLKEQSNLIVNSSDEELASSEIGNPTEEGTEAIAPLRTKEEISAEFSRIKEKNSIALEQNKEAQNIAFNVAREYQKKAKDQIQKLDEQESNQNLELSKDSAAYFSYKAQAFVEIASALENNAEDLQKRQNMIEQADVEISHLLLKNEIEQAEQKLLAVQTAKDDEKSAEFIKQKQVEASGLFDSISGLVDEIELKINSSLREKEEIEKEITQLEEEKSGANKRRAEEIELSLKSYSLDIEDLNFRLKRLKEKKAQTGQKLLTGKIEQSSWKELQVAVQEEERVPEINNDERNRIENEVIALQNEQKMLGSAATLASFEETTNDPQQQKEQQESPAIGQVAEQKTQDFGTQEDFQTVSSSKSEIEDELYQEENENPVIKRAVPSQSDSNIYSLPAAMDLLTEAKNLGDQSEQKFNKYQQVLSSIKSLPTEEERITAFEKAHKIQDEARALELQAAVVHGHANKIQYLRNTARLRSLSGSRSTNTNMILLLADEAEIYYQKALGLRQELDSADRFTKKASNFEEALELEKKALEKQNQALALLDKEENQNIPQPLDIDYRNEIANESAAKLRNEYEDLLGKLEAIRTEAEGSQNLQEKDSLMQIAQEIEQAANKKIIQANIFYTRSEGYENGEISFTENSEPQLVHIASMPDKVDSTQLSRIDENTKQAIINSNEFNEYQEVYQQKQDLINKTFTVYQRSKSLILKRDSMQQREVQLRSSALDAPSDSEKVRLIKEAMVLNAQISSLNSSLDSAGKIIKLRNYLIRRKSELLEDELKKIQDVEKAEQVVLLAKVVYAENRAMGDSFADLGSSTGDSEQIAEVTEEGDEERQNDLPSVGAIPQGSEDDKDMDEEEFEEEVVQNEQDNFPIEETESVAEGIAEKDGVEKIKGELDEVKQNEKVEEPLGFTPEVISEDIFVIKGSKQSSYNTSTPIPIDPEYPEGIVYQVQVGAFRNPIPQDHFQGFAPLMGVTGENGITRYTAGLFNDFQHADQAKDQIRSLGYKDAFVVAFRNGQRISLSEAREKQLIDGSASDVSSTGISINQTEQRTSEPESAVQELDRQELAEFTMSNTIEGTYFSIQVGVFSKPLKKGELAYDGLLIVDKLESGLYRYHIGIFDDLESAKIADESSVSKEISDSFVVAYHNGERISINQAIAILSSQ